MIPENNRLWSGVANFAVGALAVAVVSTFYYLYLLGVLGDRDPWGAGVLLVPVIICLSHTLKVGVEITKGCKEKWTRLRSPEEQERHSEAAMSWPKLWNLGSFILPGDVQEKVYEPAKVHLLRDYVRRLEYSGKWARRWIDFAFIVRTLLLVLDCLRAMMTHRACTFFKELFLGK